MGRYQRCLEALAGSVLPAGVKKHVKSKVSKKKGYLLSILGRRDLVTERGFSAMAGLASTVENGERWWNLDAPVPEGSFVLFRSDGSGMESATDATASKSIWYARLPCGGLATSTCFEIIVCLLGDFQRDDRSLGWFLSTGTCGPKRSWDKRIKPIAPNTRLRATISGSVVSFRETLNRRSNEYYEDVDERRLEKVLNHTMSQFSFGDRPWLLALSGGYDSRAILHSVRHVKHLTCVTWADASDASDTGSDLAIAKRLADRAGRTHLTKTIHRPSTAQELDVAVRRFVRFSDGRVDNFFAYLDGMKMWDELCGEGYAGLLRGDELFGCSTAMTTKTILHSMRLLSFSDYESSDLQRQLQGLHNHELPNGLQKRTGEDLTHWRMRLRTDYEIPTVYAALNAIRSRFLESTCPLLAKSLVNFAGSFDSTQLDGRQLYKRTVAHMYPEIPVATRRSIVSRPGFVANPMVQEILGDHLNSVYARNVLGARCATSAGNRIAKLAGSNTAAIDSAGRMDAGSSFVPRWVRNTKRRFAPAPKLDLPTIAMRSYLASVVESEMSEVAAMNADAWRHVRSVTA